MSRIDKFIDTESRLVVARGWEKGEMKTDNEYGIAFRGAEKKIDIYIFLEVSRRGL